MSYYAETTRGRIAFHAFDTYAEAADWLLDNLGRDYKDDFWLDDAGELVQSSRILDFGLHIHASLADAVKAQLGLDPDALAGALRAIADAIDAAGDDA